MTLGYCPLGFIEDKLFELLWMSHCTLLVVFLEEVVHKGRGRGRGLKRLGFPL